MTTTTIDLIPSGKYRISHEDIRFSLTVRIYDTTVVYADDGIGELCVLTKNGWKFERLGDVEVIDAQT